MLEYSCMYVQATPWRERICLAHIPCRSKPRLRLQCIACACNAPVPPLSRPAHSKFTGGTTMRGTQRGERASPSESANIWHRRRLSATIGDERNLFSRNGRPFVPTIESEALTLRRPRQRGCDMAPLALGFGCLPICIFLFVDCMSAFYQIYFFYPLHRYFYFIFYNYQANNHLRKCIMALLVTANSG